MILDDILSVVGLDMDDNTLKHLGTPHEGATPHSGRYRYGSGENPYQHSRDFLGDVRRLEAQGFSQVQIAEKMGLSTTRLRTQLKVAKHEERSAQVSKVKQYQAQGLNPTQIAKEMGFKNESSVRALLNDEVNARKSAAFNTADFLKKQIKEKGMIDVGAGVEKELNISRGKLDEALYILELEGYPTYTGSIKQITNNTQKTNLKVLCPPGTEHKDIYNNVTEIKSITDYISHDDGKTFKRFEYPASLDSSRLQIRYAEDGGINKDGVIELRRGVKDISLGESNYAQVRIMVDDTHYLKGMAVYSDNLPDGVDVLFNTNKHKGTPMKDVLKKKTDNPNNPFGALIKEHGGQSYYEGEDGKQHLSVINKTREEGDWLEWRDKLPSQFLGKQNVDLARQQLKIDMDGKKLEFQELSNLTNPVVKKKLLSSFANDCDSAAVHLQAASLPRQKYNVILPLNNIKDTEVYAPQYKHGETVALVRFPHGGTFEIPILKVNNKNQEGKKVITNTAADAIGINKNVADRLSGADFDGDFVAVIPCNSANSRVKITSTNPLKGLVGFDPKIEYGPSKVMVDSKGVTHAYRGDREYKVITDSYKQKQMGIVSNLITDMTIKGASEDELARAVRHSMVVIDAEKHKLDYKASEADNGIADLKRIYQSGGGTSTLLSRAKGQASTPKTKGSPTINDDGSLSYKLADSWINKKGETVQPMMKTTQMATTKDARSLISDYNTPMENVYADYANGMKSLANKARKELINTPRLETNPAAKSKYSEEIKSLNAKLDLAERNAPKEREAQRIARASTQKIVDGMDQEPTKKELQKIRQQELNAARDKTGSNRREVEIKITPSEWEAIQAGAISDHRLSSILNFTNIDVLREYATPRAKNQLSSGQVNRIKTLAASGYTVSEIADALGVSVSTINNYIK